jgi:hypothetical protein
MRTAFVVLRLAVALAIGAAAIGQISLSLGYWTDLGITNIGSNVTNFFSFFTIDANLLSLVVLVVGAVLLARGATVDPTWFLVARLSVVTYMVTTGVVYNLLLRGIELPQGSTLGWSNEILHVVAPLYLLIDWLFAPGRRPLPYRTVWAVIVFPLIWSIYTLLRGPFVEDQVFGNDYWYPYPFLNPFTSAQGYLTVAFYMLLITVIISLAALGAVWVSRRRSLNAA